MSNVVAAWSDRAVLSVSGPDATAYLQGQLSADVAGMGVGEHRWSLLLAPTGKMIAWLRVHRRAGDVYLIDLDAPGGEDALARLRMFLLRTDAAVEPLDGWCLLAVRAVDGPAPEPPVVSDGALVAAPAGATVGVVGWDLLTNDPGSVQLDAAVAIDPDAVEAVRIAHGVPAHGAEITPEVIPGELGPWLVEASVSWTKGCYTGQELVARVDSRGNNTPRHLSILTLPGASPIVPVGVDVVDADGAVVGRVSSTGPGRALALLKRSVDEGSTVVVDGYEATVERMHAGE